MKRVIFSICFALVGILSLAPIHAQDAKTVFVNMPDSIYPLLTAVNRADFIDFLESKMKAQVDNRFGRKSEMTDLGKDYIRIQMSSQSSWQLKLLAVNDSTNVICTVSTVCAPACDSHFQFYTTDWKELSSLDFIALPAMDSFFEIPDSAAAHGYAAARMQADMLLMKVDLSSKEETVTFTLTTPEYMEKEMAEKLKPFLRHPIVYTWKAGRFEP